MFNDVSLVDGLVIGRRNGEASEGAVRTYSGGLFMIGRHELQLLVSNKENDVKWGSLWKKRKYSSREEHGLVSEQEYFAEGIDLSPLLEVAGLNNKELNGKLVFAASNYKAIVDHPLHDRYYFSKEGQCNEVRAMLALQSAVVSKEGDYSYLSSCVYPRLFFGQSNKSDINKCSFVCGLRRIEPSDMPAAVNIYDGARLLRKPSMADIFVSCEHEERRVFIKGVPYVCWGADLWKLLSRHEQFCNGNVLVRRRNSGTTVIRNVVPGKYLLAWYSVRESDGSPVANETDVRLYGENFEICNVTSIIHCSPAVTSKPLPLKYPTERNNDIIGSSFFCAVENSDKRLYYYFNKQELAENYDSHTVNYRFNDHRVDKDVHCRGTLLSDIIGSLCDSGGCRLSIPDFWQIQYLENDSFHTNISTYIDSVSDARGMIRPMLAYEKMERFIHPDRYHQNAEHFSTFEEPLIYRAADSANEAVVKGVTGILLSDSRAAGLRSSAFKIKLINTDNGGKTICERIVRGALDGMRMSVRAPHLVRFENIDERPERVLVISGNPEISFSYHEHNFVSISGSHGTKNIRVSEFEDAATIIPASLTEVEELVPIGGARLIDDTKDIITPPYRNLYIDRRSVTDKTAPYGYENYLLYQYKGWPLIVLLQKLGRNHAITVHCSDGSQYNINDQNDDCFVAFSYSQSKGVPYNTAVYKRRVTELARPSLISIWDGHLIAKDVTSIIVDD